MLRKLLPHAALILSGMYLVFYLIDRVNSAMAFINNNLTKALLLVFCAISCVNALYLIRADRRAERMAQARAAEARRRREEERRREERGYGRARSYDRSGSYGRSSSYSRYR